jgi:hypothetical protein
MKITEARALAKKKWGSFGFAIKTRYGGACYTVGKWVVIGKEFRKEYYGQGISWEQAFERACEKGF